MNNSYESSQYSYSGLCIANDDQHWVVTLSLNESIRLMRKHFQNVHNKLPFTMEDYVYFTRHDPGLFILHLKFYHMSNNKKIQSLFWHYFNATLKIKLRQIVGNRQSDLVNSFQSESEILSKYQIDDINEIYQFFLPLIDDYILNIIKSRTRDEGLYYDLSSLKKIQPNEISSRDVNTTITKLAREMSKIVTMELIPKIERQTSFGTVLKICGSNETKIYHRLDCHYVNQIEDNNLIWFRDTEAARKAGYQMCACIAETYNSI